MKKIISALLILATLTLLLSSCVTGVKLGRGTTTDTNYTNETVGINFKLPSGWTFLSESEIAAMMNMTQEAMKDENLLDSMDVTSVIEFMAINNSTNDNMNMVIENLNASGNGKMTVEEYIDLSKDLIKQQLPDATYTFSGNTTSKLGNVEFTKVEAQCTYLGVNMKQYMYFKKINSHIVCINATIVSGVTAEDIENMFS